MISGWQNMFTLEDLVIGWMKDAATLVPYEDMRGAGEIEAEDWFL